MPFIDKLKPRIVSSGRIRALEIDADVFLRIEVDSLEVLIGEEGVLHLVSKSGNRLIVVKLTEKF